MEVNILRISTNSLVEANIRKAISSELPSMHDGWQFNFDKQIRKLGNASAYIIACADSPEITEGCIILQLKDNLPAYLAFIEIAPHNKTIPKGYDYVAGCLLAFAYHQSVVKTKGEYKGILRFDVSEPDPADQQKLMEVYCKKYNAIKIGDTTMVIMDDGGQKLIEQYLKTNF